MNERWADGRGPYIRMKSGRKIFLKEASAKSIHIPDVAYHGSGVLRYTGASRMPITQHMVVGAKMAEIFYPDHGLLPARFMIHDVAEHILGDVSSPLKSLLPEYRELENSWDLAVEEWANLTFLGDPLVKELDNLMWLTEREIVYLDCDEDISEDTARLTEAGLEPFQLTLKDIVDFFWPWEPDLAEEQYLTEFRRLLPWVDW